MSIWRLPVSIGYTSQGGPGVNVWHIRVEEGAFVTLDELQLATDAIRGFYADVCDNNDASGNPYAPGSLISAGEAYNVETSETAVLDFDPISSTVGGSYLPLATALVVGWRTSVAARRGRGRTFLGPIGSNALEANGTPRTEVLTNVRNAAQALIASSTATNGWAVGVYGLQNSAPSGTTDYSQLPRVLRDFTDVRVRDTFAVLRSRRD